MSTSGQPTDKSAFSFSDIFQARSVSIDPGTIGWSVWEAVTNLGVDLRHIQLCIYFCLPPFHPLSTTFNSASWFWLGISLMETILVHFIAPTDGSDPHRYNRTLTPPTNTRLMKITC